MDKHYIVVGPIDPETSAPEWEVEHPNGCETADVEGVIYYRCPVGIEIDESGIDAFGWMRGDMGNNWPREFPTEPGKYEIEAWGEKYWTDYGWEYDGGLRLV